MKKKRIKLTLISIFLLIIGLLYAKVVISSDKLDVLEKPSDGQEQETHPVKVKLVVNDGSTIIEYSTRLNTNDSVATLLEHLRNNDEFSYRKIAYTYGTELDNINGLPAPECFKWQLYDKDENQITYDFEYLGLEDGDSYILRLDQICES